MKTTSLKKAWAQWQVLQLVFILSLSVIIPFFMHLIPAVAGVPVGAVLIPMFYAPLIAVLLFRPHVAIVSGLFSPPL